MDLHSHHTRSSIHFRIEDVICIHRSISSAFRNAISATMRSFVSLVVASAASCALALPASLQPRADSYAHSHGTTSWDDGATTDFVIHSSCNASETMQLRKGLADAVALADHAKAHILRWGNSSEHYRKYFGNAPSGEAIGYYEKVINGDKGNALFRCDNPDGNCDQPGMYAHNLFCPSLNHYTYVKVSSQNGAGTGEAKMLQTRRSSAPYPTQPDGH